ncbi:hypothetical protein LFYK43_17450 [Ligilactobacillus salitolerans]|uniref:Uncharacterized protein n=1 Tax=Ligilactobacillus salitolerans TaxID=1808352 RepID=A0A401IUU2_9LACO|nr:NYN domain-containing protein [Ligilactobacillus salitolerans]GBG95286.1 hypothetical protein LFYK43_17450 [Ligilactobacillus salitolerans]
MKKNILIVDAYNMIGNWPKLNKLKKDDRLEDARDLLLQVLSDYHKQSGAQIIVVFDAMYVPGLSKSYRQYTLQVIWTDEGQTADSYIESLAGELMTPLTTVTVATSDQAEQWTIFSQGALRKPAWELAQDIKRARTEVKRTARQYQDQHSLRGNPWDEDQLEDLKRLRDHLSK